MEFFHRVPAKYSRNKSRRDSDDQSKFPKLTKAMLSLSQSSTDSATSISVSVGSTTPSVEDSSYSLSLHDDNSSVDHLSDGEDFDFIEDVLDCISESQESESDVLRVNGYQRVDDQSVSEGADYELFNAERITPPDVDLVTVEGSDDDNHENRLVLIKRVRKNSSSETHLGVNEMVMARHLTTHNEVMADRILAPFARFESQHSVYLVYNWCHGESLKKFLENAHQLINDGTLSTKEFRRWIRNILWQILVTLDMMHSIYRCCHLSLSMSKIIISGAEFVAMNDGSTVIRGDMKVKVMLDSKTQRFADKSFKYNKGGKRFDARAIDLISIGNVTYQCMAGVGAILDTVDDLSIIHDIVQGGYWRFEYHRKPLYLSGYNTFRLIKCDSFRFLKQFLNLNVKSRELMQSPFLRSYYDRNSAALNAVYLNAMERVENLNFKMKINNYRLN